MRLPHGASLILLAALAAVAAPSVAVAAPAPVAVDAPAPPGAAVRVSFDRSGIRAVRVQGLADPFTGRKVSADDPVRIASVSKLVVALGVMRLVDQRRIDLDRDVSAYLGWRLRHPDFPDRPITLALLLSHRAGLVDGIDYAIPLGGSLRDSLTARAAWAEGAGPGDRFRYANLNFPVIATVLEAATDTRFDRLMHRLVMKPLRLDACFNWPLCSDRAIARAVVLTDAQRGVRRDRLDGVRPACPVVAAADGSCDLARYVPGTNGALFSPQGGLRISGNDLARIGQMLLRRGAGFLSRASYARLTRPVWQFDGHNGDSEGGLWCRYALAVQTLATPATGCRDDPFGDGRPRLGHPGEAYGLRSGLWIDPARGTGVAYFLTAIDDNASQGRSALTAAEEAWLRQGGDVTLIR